METYKTTPEWEALNRIWKHCAPTIRQACEADFKLISQYIMQHYTPKTRPVSSGRYLSGLSEKSREFVLSHEPNLYHSLMAVLDNRSFESSDELLKYYMQRYKIKRPYLAENQVLVEEVINHCWHRYHRKRHKMTENI